MQGRQLDISQRALRPTICAYLIQQNADPVLIDNFKRGFCCGYVLLALICYYLEKHSKKANQDNWTWLMQVLHLLLDEPAVWKHLSHKNHLDIQRCISLLEMLQHTSLYWLRVAQGDLPTFFEATNGLTAQLEFRISGLFTLQHFLKPVHYKEHGIERHTTLLAEIFKYQHRLVVISKGGHTFGMMRDGAEINFIESNSKSLKKTQLLTHGLSTIAQFLFQIAKYDPHTPSSFGIRIFSFDGIGNYVLPSVFLAALKPPCFNGNSAYGKGYSSLHIAARIGDVVSLGYYLSKTVHVNCSTQKQYTPLYLAAAKGYDLAVDLLLLQGADPHFSNKSCIGSAIARGHYEIAASLRANKSTGLFAVKRSTSLPILLAKELPASP